MFTGQITGLCGGRFRAEYSTVGVLGHVDLAIANVRLQLATLEGPQRV